MQSFAMHLVGQGYMSIELVSACRLARLLGPLVLLAVGACSGGGPRCEDVMRYATSSTAAPIRVPGDLSVPDESDALQIPNAPPLDVPDPESEGECLERPPEFFAD